MPVRRRGPRPPGWARGRPDRCSCVLRCSWWTPVPHAR